MSNSIPIAEGGLLVAILAAGQARRFGGDKLDRICAGQQLGTWAVAASEAARLPRGIIVVPPEPPGFTHAAEGWFRLANPAPERGIGSSVALAAQAARDAQAAALLILLADMPLVEPDFLATLVASEVPAATRYPGDRAGVPALIPAELFELATSLSDDRGLGSLLSTRDDVTLLDPPPDMLLDIDHPDDLTRAAQLLAARQAP